MDLLELLGDPAYRHMLLNHVPVVGLAVALVVLAAGAIARQRALLLCGLALVAITAGLGVVAAHYGEAAYPAIYDRLDGHGRAWLDHHAEVAERWLPLLWLTAGAALAGLFTGVLRRTLLSPAALLVLALGLAGLAGAAIVAASGGRVQHPEFRLEPLPR